jgi:hypothetical protein
MLTLHSDASGLSLNPEALQGRAGCELGAPQEDSSRQNCC